MADTGNDDPAVTLYRHAEAKIAKEAEVGGHLPCAAKRRVQAPIRIVAGQNKIRAAVIGASYCHDFSIILHGCTANAIDPPKVCRHFA